MMSYLEQGRPSVFGTKGKIGKKVQGGLLSNQEVVVADPKKVRKALTESQDGDEICALIIAAGQTRNENALEE